MQGGTLHRGAVWVSRGLVISRFCVLDLLEDLFSYHLVNESLLFLSVFGCLSNLPDLYFSLIIVYDLNYIIIPHLSRVIRRQRINTVIPTKVLQLIFLSSP